MLGGLLDLHELSVADVMVHRTKMRTINADLSAAEIVREVLASPYTRMPLWRDKHENIVGILHAKDLLRALDSVGGDAEKLKIAQISYEPWFVPDMTSLRDQLRAFLSKKTHFALVVDEYGEVGGAGDSGRTFSRRSSATSRTSTNLSVQGVRVQPDGSVHAEGGSVPIRDLNRVMDWNLPDEEATTYCRPRHPRGPAHPRCRPGLHLPRLPLPGPAQGPQPHHLAAHHPLAVLRAAGIGNASSRRRFILAPSPRSPAGWRS